MDKKDETSNIPGFVDGLITAKSFSRLGGQGDDFKFNCDSNIIKPIVNEKIKRTGDKFLQNIYF